MNSLEIKARLSCRVRFDDRVGEYVGYCPALKVHSQAESKEKALSALSDGIQLLLRTHYKRGTLEEFLSERGFSLSQGGFQPLDSECFEHDSVSVRTVPQTGTLTVEEPCEITVPFYLIQEAQRRSLRPSA